MKTNSQDYWWIDKCFIIGIIIMTTGPIGQHARRKTARKVDIENVKILHGRKMLVISKSKENALFNSFLKRKFVTIPNCVSKVNVNLNYFQLTLLFIMSS